MRSNELYYKAVKMVAIIMIATIAVSCKSKITKIAEVDVSIKPEQTIEGVTIIQSTSGLMEFRAESPLMERYPQNSETGAAAYELFPKGIRLYAYNEEGFLETEIVADGARHINATYDEKWEAYGNVVIKNHIKGERIETDTLYWNKEEKKIHTHCYVTITSPQGFMQGYGMESDEMARDAYLLKPFDSYGIIQKDSTKVEYIDSVNFIGPLYIR